MGRSVAVVVVTYNSAELLPDFLASLDDGMFGIDRFQVIVADNASSDGTVDVVKRLRPDAIIAELSSNRGYAAGINAAVAAGDHLDAILVLNDDIRLQPGSVARLYDALQAAHAGIAVPRLVDGKGDLLLSQRIEPTLRTVFSEAILGGRRAGSMDRMSELIHDTQAYEVESDITWASGCAWLISRPCWDAVGPWDESFFLYAEDLDYALRARDAGFAIRFTPDAQAVHLVGPSQRDPRLWSMLIWNRYRLYTRRHGSLRGRMFWLGLVLNEGVRSVRPGSIHRAGLKALLFESKRPAEVRGH